MKRFLPFLSLLLLLLPSGAYATTYSTWNAADCNANVTLSGGNLTTAMGTVGGTFPARMCRSTISKTSGKWYWEVTVTSGTVANTAEIGVDNGSGSLTQGVGQPNINGYGWYNGGGVFHGSNTQSGTQATYTVGDVLGVGLDMDNKTIQFYKNGVATGAQITGISSTEYAGIGTAGDVFNATTNFGATALTYAPPAGFCAGLADVCPSTSKFSYWGFFTF